MASNLVPERPLLFSPTLAATIGLEEAILLQVLMDFAAHRSGSLREQFKWVEIRDDELEAALPFWTLADIKRVDASLRNLGMILRSPDTDHHYSYLYALNEKVDVGGEPQSNAMNDRNESRTEVESPVFRQGRGNAIPADWTPGREWLEQCRQHNISDEFSLSLVPEFVNYWRDRGQARFSWGNAFYKHVLRSWREEQTRRGASELASAIARDWQPSMDALEILVNSGIPQDFIEDAIPEFVLYWQERGMRMSTWNTKFVEHIRRQWDKFNASFGHDNVPRPLPVDWQPSPSCFEILQLAEIDVDYARAKVPEFVLYWRDSQQARPSWNTVFLQYIKQDWARRLKAPLEVKSEHGDHQSPVGQNQQSVEERIRQLTDRSWAENARRW